VTISVEGLSKRFNRDWIIKNFSFQFKSGNTYAVIGPNGSGKSTLLQLLSGQMPPSAGLIQYSTGQNQTIEVDEIYKHIAFAAPYMDLVDEFTVEEQIRFHFRLKPLRAKYTPENVLDLVYLQRARDRFIRDLSSGMKQRLKLSLAFYADCQIILLDEPGTNLDSTAFAWYTDQLGRLPNDVIVIIASNNPSEYSVNAHILDVSEIRRAAEEK
jgi:ABC-type multidrug transport system ATPase subunit